MSGDDFFNVDLDHGAKRIDVRISGFWHGKTFETYEAAINRALAECEERGGSSAYCVLIDSRNGMVQASSILQKIERLSATLAVRVRRKAIVVSNSTLTKMQQSRIEMHLNMRSFPSIGEAKAWLSAS
jgi:hypothetical protein